MAAEPSEVMCKKKTETVTTAAVILHDIGTNKIERSSKIPRQQD
jgi:hypothetical protein